MKLARGLNVRPAKLIEPLRSESALKIPLTYAEGEKQSELPG
jgi:hypothetical protein